MFFMMFAVSIICLILGYIFYGRFMARVYNLDNHNVTPAERLNDGMDYCPTHPAVVLGHHFSSIAGAGPIVGPITAASMFGWLPTIVWASSAPYSSAARMTSALSWPRCATTESR